MHRTSTVVTRIVGTVAIALGLCAAATAQRRSLRPALSERGGVRAEGFEAIAAFAREELQQSRTPGAAIALVEGVRVVYTTGVGVADVESGAPVKPDMLFRLGSTTKMFTATALVTLAEEGQLSLDAPIGGTVRGLDPAIARLTPNQLLSHTAGLRDDAPMFGRQDDEALGDGIRAMKTTAFFTETGRDLLVRESRLLDRRSHRRARRGHAVRRRDAGARVRAARHVAVDVPADDGDHVSAGPGPRGGRDSGAGGHSARREQRRDVAGGIDVLQRAGSLAVRDRVHIAPAS